MADFNDWSPRAGHAAYVAFTVLCAALHVAWRDLPNRRGTVIITSWRESFTAAGAAGRSALKTGKGAFGRDHRVIGWVVRNFWDCHGVYPALGGRIAATKY
jgi:hypothetical protein